MNERSIFLDALELTDPQQRREYLDRACGDDQELRSQVEELLVSHNEASSFLEKPPEGLAATIAGRVDNIVGESTSGDSLEFLDPSAKPGCLGTLSQYEVVEVVGRGGMGLVLRAYDTKLNRVVAIKVMAPELAANAMAVKRFLREARAAAAVSHDHVVTIHAIEEDNRPPYIVMEFVDGQSLQEKIDRTGSMELKEILRIGMQMARGLAAAHDQGLVHRDIKPANILLENGVERVKLTDFGLARAVDDVSVTRTGQIAGTPQFMSPEQAQGHAIDARSDLFSLGSVLYTMCTGRPPFRADSAVAMLRRVTDDDPRRIREVNADIPDWLDAIIFKLLAKEPDERFQTAEEVAELLSRHLAHMQHATMAPMPQPVGLRQRSPGLPAAVQQPGTFLQFSIRTILAVIFMFGVALAVFVPFVRAQPPAYGRYLVWGAVISSALAVVVLLHMCFRRWRIETRGGTVLLRPKRLNPWLDYLPNIIMFFVFAGILVGQTIWLVPTMKKIALSDQGGLGFGLWSSVCVFSPMMMGLVYAVTLTWWQITPMTLDIRENGIVIGGLRYFEWSAIFGCQWRDGKHVAILTLWYPSALWNTVRRKVAMMPLEAREPVQRLLETKGIKPWPNSRDK